MKTCIVCTKEYDLSFFQKQKGSIDGHRNQCKFCRYKQKNERNKKKNNLITVEYKICNKCQINKFSSEFHKCKAHSDGLTPLCKKCRKEDTKAHYQRHKQQIKEKVMDYYQKNKPIISQKRKGYTSKRCKTDILFRLSRRLRNRLYYALKRAHWKKGVKFNEYIGCSLEDLKAHLEKQFQPGMSWDNYGAWHIDHIIPLSKALTEQEMYDLCHWTNLQPMWAKENITKGNK